jgi:Transposase IS116/IS110/IS902 family
VASVSHLVPIHLGLDVHKDTISVGILDPDQQVPVADPPGTRRQGQDRPAGLPPAGPAAPRRRAGRRPHPTVGEEAVRDLCCTRADMVQDLTRARNRLGKFLLRHGRPWRGSSTRTQAYQAWLRSQRFDQPAMAQTFGHYLAVVEVRNQALDAVEADLVGWCQRPPFDWQVARLAAYRGVTRLGALHLAAEVADWRRFATAKAFMGFCGLVPSEYSSGHTVHRGRLTKAGNAHLRAQLAWVGLVLPAPAQRRRRARPPPARPRPCDPRPGVGGAAAPVEPLPPAGRPQAHQEHRRRGHRSGARRVPVGRDDRLTALTVHRSRSAEEVTTSTTRRDAAAAGPIPGSPMPRPGRGEPSQGHLPAYRRRAVQPANISVAVSRSTPSRRVAPSREWPGHHPIARPDHDPAPDHTLPA